MTMAIFKIVGVSLVLLVAWVAFSMKPETITSEIWINRSPDQVWRVLSKTGSYRSWNPFIVQFSGELVEGNTVEISLASPGDSPMIFRPIVLKVSPGRELCWKGNVIVKGIFDGEHCMLLREENGGTRFEQRETFSGVLVSRLTRGILRRTQIQFGEMNAALKARTEANID